MYDKVVRTVQALPRLGTTGYSFVEPNRYVYAGTDNIWIQSDLGYRLFTDMTVMTLLRNIIPKNKTPGAINYDWSVYESSLSSGVVTDCTVYSAIAMTSVFGQKLTTESNYAHLDFIGQQIRTPSETFYTTPVNANVPAFYLSKTYNVNNFVYATNAIFVTEFIPRYEELKYPGYVDRNYGALSGIFETAGRDYIDVEWSTLSKMSIDTTVRIYRPKLLFQPAGTTQLTTWYSYDTDTSQFVVQTPNNGQYFTFSEFRAKGNTFTEYQQIVKTKFTDIADTSWRVLCNNHLVPVFVNHSYWIDSYDLYQFLWVTYRNNKNIVVVGTI